MDTDEYRKLAEVEDRMWYFRSLHAHAERELESGMATPEFPGEPGRPRILDAGCGTGGLIVRLGAAHPKWKFQGLDFMPRACELARSRCGPGVDIRQGSITALPFDDGSFDVVVSVDVVCQVDEDEKAFAEFHRVLRPGGILVINLPAYMWMWSYHDDTVQTRHRYTRAEVEARLAAAGFGDRRLTHWNSLSFPAIWAKRKLFCTRRDVSDVKPYPALVDAGFSALMKVEHAWIRAGGRWAWGTSVFAVARRH